MTSVQILPVSALTMRAWEMGSSRGGVGGFPNQFLFTQRLPGTWFYLRFSNFLPHHHPDLNTQAAGLCTMRKRIG